MHLRNSHQPNLNSLNKKKWGFKKSHHSREPPSPRPVRVLQTCLLSITTKLQEAIQSICCDSAAKVGPIPTAFSGCIQQACVGRVGLGTKAYDTLNQNKHSFMHMPQLRHLDTSKKCEKNQQERGGLWVLIQIRHGLSRSFSACHRIMLNVWVDVHSWTQCEIPSSKSPDWHRFFFRPHSSTPLPCGLTTWLSGCASSRSWQQSIYNCLGLLKMFHGVPSALQVITKISCQEFIQVYTLQWHSFHASPAWL